MGDLSLADPNRRASRESTLAERRASEVSAPFHEVEVGFSHPRRMPDPEASECRVGTSGGKRPRSPGPERPRRLGCLGSASSVEAWGGQVTTSVRSGCDGSTFVGAGVSVVARCLIATG